MTEPRTGRRAVQSPVIDLMNQFEFAAFAEGVELEAVGRICNRMLFGDPDGSAGYEEGGPQRYHPGIDAALTRLADRPGLNSVELAAIRRVRHLIFGGDPDGYGGST